MLFSKEKKQPVDKKHAAGKKRPAARTGAARPAAARPGADQQPRRRPPQQTAAQPQSEAQAQAGESFEVP